ncbi:peptidoglycan DD-metalloendopeptidase family protein [Mesorhizobium sp. BR1-1-16]|uniref:murein hydrolase activator EnvC family protein n=1 Tax=Mesorhizobium sp. BR1-1-16 TaxID=2876653 RepID=UPI001CCBB50F|nr:peptidoglycan DD-metalloendopeptidase family protein [Mesorhizobium sp. BR1-1-16]MBZ9937427.1 peptidoglycan DD-metalloendopeptidase family protein [Mesorhizobium sp. BR1-1-16]
MIRPLPLSLSLAFVAFAAASVLLWPERAAAQAPAAQPAAAETAPVDPAEAARTQRRAELDAITHDIEVTRARQDELKAEIDKLDKDSASLTQSMVETGERAKQLERQLGEAEMRMSSLLDEEKTVRASLSARRGVLANVLAALQRMGRKPPPAIVVRPEDALAAVRSAMLLGAVVPELRTEADGLTADLQHLLALKDEKARERDRVRADATALAEEQTRIQLLVAEKKKARAASEEALASEQTRSEQLAAQASSLQDLIDSLEKQVAASADAAAAAKAAEERNKAAIASGEAPRQPDNLGAANRIEPAVAFADTKGLLPRPVNGVEVKSFGDADGLGGTTAGVSIATRASAGVSSPSDGWVVYAGPFRSYGQLLIINAGGGYHVLLAGMERINVELGQFVLAGEPVGVMGTRQLASMGAEGIGAQQPLLYVEFRKDGTSIDPAPWWARSSDEKVGG